MGKPHGKDSRDYNAAFIAVRIISMIIGTGIFLTYTTTPIQLTDGIEHLLSPLKALHVPVHEFAMMMTIALRFIPTIIEETEKIMAAQKARGADFSPRGLYEFILNHLCVRVCIVSNFC